MVSSHNQDDAVSEASTTAFTTVTSLRDPSLIDGLWDGRTYAVPWPDNTYIIVEKGTSRAITLTNNGLRLQDTNGQDEDTHNNRWLCVEKNGYFGLCNPRTGRYLGHDGKSGMRAGATVLDFWELITPRRHPSGGYQLLLPHNSVTLKMVTVAEDGRGLARRQHGQTLWEFIKV
ncbi:hypothetical protein ACO1O0_004975 [Amphichorda felina]